MEIAVCNVHSGSWGIWQVIDRDFFHIRRGIFAGYGTPINSVFHYKIMGGACLPLKRYILCLDGIDETKNDSRSIQP